MGRGEGNCGRRIAGQRVETAVIHDVGYCVFRECRSVIQQTPNFAEAPDFMIKYLTDRGMQEGYLD